jgi:5-methylcytosine-specific restriction endonuclease McrA
MEGSMLRLVKLLCLLAALVAGAAAATGATASRPVGAIAHGGVMKSLDDLHAARRTRLRVGHSVLLAPRTRTSHCRLAALPDRSCSPGAYSPRLTKAVICSSRFHHRKTTRVSRSEKHAVEREYGLPTGSYSRALVIDHIVPLRVGGTNNIANLFPEEYAFANHSPGYVVKNRLDGQLRARICAGRIALRAAQRQIAANWERLFRKTFGHPAGRPRG